MKTHICKVFISIIFLTSNFYRVHSQDKIIVDSLQKAFDKSKQDTTRTQILMDLGNEYLNNDPGLAAKYFSDAIEISRKIKYETGIAYGLGMLGVAYTNLGKFEDAKKTFDEGLTLSINAGLKEDQSRIYNSWANLNYYQGDYNESIKNHEKSISIKKELGDEKGIAYSYNNISYNHYALGKYPEMISIATKALKILEAHNDSDYIAEIFNTIGGGYFGMGNYSEAIKNYLTSIKIRESRGDKYGAAACYLNIGSINNNRGYYSEALKNYEHSLKLYEEIKDRNNIGTIYYSIGETYLNQNKNKDALKYFLQALEIKKETGDKSVLALTYSNIGEVFYNEGKYDEALQNHFKGLEIKNEIGEKQSIAISYTGIGKIYTKLKKYNEAKKYFELSSNISQEIGEKEVLKKNYQAMSELNESQKDFENALINYKLFSVIKDSLVNDNNNKRIAELSANFQLEKKDSENALLKQDNLIKAKENEQEQQLRNFVLIASLILIGVLVFAFYNFYSRRKITFKRTVERVNNKALRSQMNPHFIFNALQSIQSFLMKNNARDANDYLLKFSKLMRLVLENSQHQEVTIAEDKEALELYMQLESIRLKKPFTYTFNIDGRIDINTTKIPPLILQPVIENAIWHGLQSKDEAGRIDINISQKGDELHCIVEDNGIGRDLSRRVEKPMMLRKESLGMKLTEERLKIINELKKIKTEFRIVDLTSANNQPIGTRVELSIPLV